MRRFMLLLLTGFIIFSASDAFAITLTWNELCDETYGATVGAHVFADRLNELSGGTMGIDLYIDGALGDEAISMQSLQWGTLDIFRGNAVSLLDYGATQIAATGMPFLFPNMEEFECMAISPLGQELLDSVAEANCGFVAIAWLVEGPRYLFLTENGYEKIGRPDKLHLSQMNKLNLRVPGSEVIQRTIDALGAHSIKIEYPELKQSLQSGNIDGAENGIIPYISLDFYRNAPYFVMDAHTFGCGVILVNADVWKDLTDEQKSWMKEAGRAASDACYEYNLHQEKEFFNAFSARGVTILPVSDIWNWQNACEPIYTSQNKEAQNIITRIRNHDY